MFCRNHPDWLQIFANHGPFRGVKRSGAGFAKFWATQFASDGARPGLGPEPRPVRPGGSLFQDGQFCPSWGSAVMGDRRSRQRGDVQQAPRGDGRSSRYGRLLPMPIRIGPTSRPPGLHLQNVAGGGSRRIGGGEDEDVGRAFHAGIRQEAVAQGFGIQRGVARSSRPHRQKSTVRGRQGCSRAARMRLGGGV